MKNIITFVTILIFLCVSTILSQENNSAEKSSGTFILFVVGLESDDGKVMIALFNSEEGYSETGKNLKSNAIEIKDSKVVWTIEDLPFGEYAIKLYHDENGNGKMDKNMLGIPSEDYGFSNNASSSFGPANYEDAKFIFNTSGQQHEINLD